MNIGRSWPGQWGDGKGLPNINIMWLILVGFSLLVLIAFRVG